MKWSAAVLALAGVVAAALPAHAATCWRDYPLPTTAVDYERTLGGGTLVPARVMVDRATVAIGASEARIERVFGASGAVAEDWRPRSAEQHCADLIALLRAHPDSMHLYTYGALAMRGLAGDFRVVEWPLPGGAGRLRAYFHRPDAAAPASAYLLHLVLDAGGAVHRKPGRRLVLVRKGTPAIEWDVYANHVAFTRPHQRR
ncbi:hypothetical protein [Aquincola sp. J276]|uniref:hypothetical protein n=1 Tax=Aquincola sp. J276 TaxID=2898432 RepID=UPI002150F22D|nr:hypothetical protein [Aquincola sp. J276]MCR5864040.1 hypothetical protein [Aquincola sp. J276]